MLTFVMFRANNKSIKSAKDDLTASTHLLAVYCYDDQAYKGEARQKCRIYGINAKHPQVFGEVSAGSLRCKLKANVRMYVKIGLSWLRIWYIK
jgi:hypothetical protein